MPRQQGAQLGRVAVDQTTRGGWAPTGIGAERRASVVAAPGSKAHRTRQRLLDAARTAFARHGYLDTTVDQIVNEAGVARGSFYTYFESKTDIFRHLAALIDRRVESAVVAFDRPRHGNPISNLEISNRNYLSVVRDNADLYRLVDQVAAFDDSVGKARLRSHQQHAARVAVSIRRWQTRGWADAHIDTEITAAALVSMLSGFAQWLYVGGDSYDDEQAVTTLTGIWVAACRLAPPASSERQRQRQPTRSAPWTHA
jgi:AcrR family transcriptional regulator